MNKGMERKQNLLQIIEMLRRHGAMTQALLKGYCQLQASTVSYLVNDLKRIGLVVDSGRTQQEGRVGKPGVLVQLNNDQVSFLGIYAEDNQLDVYLIGVDGTQLAYEQIVFDQPSVEDTIFAAIRRKLAMYGQIKGVGIAVKAIVYKDGSIKSGKRTDAAQGFWSFAGLSARLNEAFPGLVIAVENDANCAATLCQYRHVDQNQNLVVYLLNKAPFGLGCGLVMNGSIYQGHRGAAGEFFEKNTKLRELAESLTQEKDIVERFLPSILPHVLETAYLLDPQLVVLCGSYVDGLGQQYIQAIQRLFADVPAPVQIAAGAEALNPAKGAALLATNGYMLRLVEEVNKR